MIIILTVAAILILFTGAGAIGFVFGIFSKIILIVIGISLITALIAAVVIIIVVRRILLILLKKNQPRISESEIIGMIAVVTKKVFKTGFGTVAFIYNGKTVTLPAKSRRRFCLPVNTQVVILENMNDVYLVEEI